MHAKCGLGRILSPGKRIDVGAPLAGAVEVYPANEVGEGVEKKEENFVEEVMAQVHGA